MGVFKEREHILHILFMFKVCVVLNLYYVSFYKSNRISVCLYQRISLSAGPTSWFFFTFWFLKGPGKDFNYFEGRGGCTFSPPPHIHISILMVSGRGWWKTLWIFAPVYGCSYLILNINGYIGYTWMYCLQEKIYRQFSLFFGQFINSVRSKRERWGYQYFSLLRVSLYKITWKSGATSK